MITIGGVGIGGGNPCRFVAELSNNHNGSLARCLRLITAAKDAGADFIKLQCYTASELVALRGDGPAPEPWGSQGWTMRALYEKAATPFDWFPAIAEYCRDLEVPWFSSAFGRDSLALLGSLECPAYKLARLDNKSKALGESMHAPGKPLIVSERRAGESWLVPDLSLLCPEGYPQSAFALGSVQFIGRSHPDDERDIFDGFSFHGTDPMPCVVAATLGAKLIEAHFQLDDEPSELEANVSLTASQFAQMIADVRRVEAMLA